MADTDEHDPPVPSSLGQGLPHDPDLGPEGERGPGIDRPGGIPPMVLLAVLAGGLAGTLGRYELALAWAPPPVGFPAAIFTINTSGAFLLGLILTVLVRPPLRHRSLRAFLGTGLLGGWTTYSTLAVGSAVLTKQGHAAVAVAYLGASLVAGLLAVGLGMALGRALSGPLGDGP